MDEILGERILFPAKRVSDDAVKAMHEFKPKSSDVFIVTPPKCGTTFTQAVVHQLKHPGDPYSFEDIYDVSPWYLLVHDTGLKLDDSLCSNQSPPRAFKTHQPLKFLPRGCKYICVVRNPEAVLISWYRFILSHGNPLAQKYEKDGSGVNGFVFEEEYFANDMSFGASLWEYYAQFWQCRKLEQVLIVAYEDLVGDLPSQLKRMAKFLDLPQLNEKQISQIQEMTSKQVMASDEHSKKFDESVTSKRLKQINTMPKEGQKKFTPSLRVNKEKHKDILNEKTLNFLEEKWQTFLGKPFGLENYQQFKDQITI